MKIRSRALLGLLVVAGTAGATLLACSDDDEVTPNSDAGTDGPTSDAPTGPTCEDAGAPSCTAEACRAQFGGDAGFCIEGTCVPAITQDCPRAGGDLTGSNQIVIGAMLLNASTGPTRANSLELAINEINAAGGIPDPDACKPARTLAFVQCDDTNPGGSDAGTDRIRGGRHLIDDLKVPAILGGSNSGNTLDIANNLTIPAKTMLFAPSSTAATIAALSASPDGTRIVWRAAPSDNGQTVALQKVFADVVPAAATPLKVALVTANDAYGKGIAAGFQNGLLIDGAAPTAGNFRAIEYRKVNGTGDGVDQAAAVTALNDFAPTIVVMAGTAEANSGVLEPYEEGRGGRPAPYYVLADGQKKDDLITYVNTPGKATFAAGFHARLRGTQPGVVTQQLTQNFFNLGYKTAYGADSILSYGMAGAYDIGYMLAYAVAATKGGAVTGTTLSQNMSLLVGGTEGIDVGTAALARGMTAMLGGTKVDFNGASGPLDFDLTTGEAPSDYSIWCLKNDPNNAGKYLFEEVAGQSYAAKTQTLTGTFACP